MKISNRAIEMNFSPIRKLIPLADEAEKRGVKVYKLNIGQPNIVTYKNSARAFTIIIHNPA